MGFDKILAPLSGRPVLWHSIRALAVCPDVDALTLVIRPEIFEQATECAASAAQGKPVQIVYGGPERHLSVWAGLQSIGVDAAFVAVHDAARPLVSAQAVAGCLALAREHGAASCAAPVSDTLKRADAAQFVCGGVDRTGLWGMQTPQIFQTPLLLRAYESLLHAGGTVTDEVSAVETLGVPVALYHNREWNLKITFPSDVMLAELMLADRELSRREATR